MNDADREEIARIKTDLDHELISDLSREAAHRALTLAANAANGCKTEEERSQMTAAAIYALAVMSSRTLVEVATAVKSHATGCPLRATAGQTVPLSGVAGKVAAIVAAIRPVSWPVAIAIGAIASTGNLPAIIEAVAKYCQ
jgi:hypothetical protein